MLEQKNNNNNNNNNNYPTHLKLSFVNIQLLLINGLIFYHVTSSIYRKRVNVLDTRWEKKEARRRRQIGNKDEKHKESALPASSFSFYSWTRAMILRMKRGIRDRELTPGQRNKRKESKWKGKGSPDRVFIRGRRRRSGRPQCRWLFIIRSIGISKRYRSDRRRIDSSKGFN